MILREIEVLRGLIGSKSRHLHFWAIFVMLPCSMWVLWHLPRRECIWCSFLMAGGIVEQEKASYKPIWFYFENINILNLLKQVFPIKIFISVLPRFKEYVHLTKFKGESHNCKCMNLFLLFSMDQPPPFGCWNSDTMIDCPSPFFSATAFAYLEIQWILQWSFS